MEVVKVVIEPDILIDRIRELFQRDEKDIKPDTIGLETRLRTIHGLFNREASVAVSPNLPYETKRELVIRIQEEVMTLADAGYEAEALQIAGSGGTVCGLGMCGGYITTYLDLIPPDKRAEEFELRELVESKP